MDSFEEERAEYLKALFELTVLKLSPLTTKDLTERFHEKLASVPISNERGQTYLIILIKTCLQFKEVSKITEKEWEILVEPFNKKLKELLKLKLN